MTATITLVRIVNLISSGLADYRDVDALQRKLHHEVCEGAEDALILVEFTPTYTAGRHTKDHHIPDSSLPIEEKPQWIKTTARVSDNYSDMHKLSR